MATYTPLEPFGTAGIAGQSSDTINAGTQTIITGDQPVPVARDHNVAAGQTLAALTVVGLDGSGRVIPATSIVQAVGVLLADVVTAGGDTTRYAPVWRTGVFNPDVLIWDSTLGTDALRFDAFEGAPTPTQIFMRRPKTMTVPAPA